MKKTILVMASLAMLVACGGGGEKTTESETKKEEAPAKADITADPNYQKGVEIVAKSDCATCHHINDKLIGPAWAVVADKYAGQDTAVAYLAKKIKEGGSGVWGDVPMASHPLFTQEEAETVAKYVLLLKTK